MKFYFAPMEGVTSYTYRNAHNDFFHNVDQYYTPFIVPTQIGKLRTREKNDILPEHNEKLHIVPQILTNNSEDFIHLANDLYTIGYEEINLNLGCPSGTVVSKGKGSGFLAQRDRLDQFLEEIFEGSKAKISVKTRLGKDNPEEFYELIKIYNQYPIKELTIHARVQADYYKNKPNLSVFKDACSLSKNPVCYNGDIFNVSDYQKFIQLCPEVDSIMLGRGLIANPALISEITQQSTLSKDTLRAFHDRIVTDYESIQSGDTNVLFKMKELWSYMIQMFPDSEKYMKKIRKCTKLSEYEIIINHLFKEKELNTEKGFCYGGR